jgi:hypothetical protein
MLGMQSTMRNERHGRRNLLRAAGLLAGITLAGCSGGGGGGGGGGPTPPSGVVAFAGDTSVTLTWAPVSKADFYTVYWGTTAGVTKQTGTPIHNVKAPFQHTGLTNLQKHFYIVASVRDGKEGGTSSEVSAIPHDTAGQFDPPWSTIPPTQTLTIDYDPNQTPEAPKANGLLLAAKIASLVPGDRLEIGDGQWMMPDFFSIDVVGNAGAPIWIAAKPGHRPTITRADANDAIAHVGAAGGARYVALIGLELVDGGRGLDLWDAQEIWINLNLMSRTGDTPIAADNFNTSKLYVTRNQIDHAGGEGHGIVLGTSFGFQAANAIIAQNQVSHCRGLDATGIWVRQGSYGNWIVENFVHDTDWPCILVAGTGNAFKNTIERNTCFNSKDNVMEVQSEALVRNNLLINGHQGFSSQDDFATVRDIEVVHNTIINSRRGAHLSQWANRPNVVFANNAVYSNVGESVSFHDPEASNGVYFQGNVVLGPVEGAASGFVNGNGLQDFVDVSWSGIKRDATPSANSPLIDAADPNEFLPDDLTGKPRDPVTMETGCLDL